VWQRVWDERSRAFGLLGVAQEAHGDDHVRRYVEQTGVDFPVVVDATHLLGRELGFRIVPSGFFLDADVEILYRHVDDFDVADPRVRWNLERFLAGEPTESPADGAPMAREALELFARDVMPEFKEREAERVTRKTEELAPYVEAAFARKAAMPALSDAEIPTYPAYGLTIAEPPHLSKMPEANRRRYLTYQKMKEIAERA
jgi:hypothetical protein